jgi:outer membrane cobalamin receptor
LLLKSRFLFCFLLAAACLRAQEGSSPSSSPPTSEKITVHHESVIVTGTFIPVPQTELDRSLNVIETDGQELLYQNWVDYLALPPSVDLRRRAPADVQGDLSIRGSTFGQTLVLLNGLRMDDVQTAHHDLDLPLPTDAVRRIEVLRGAGSTLYGSDAMAGTINVITGRPQRSDLRLAPTLEISEPTSRTAPPPCCGDASTRNSMRSGTSPVDFGRIAITAT